MRTNENLQNDVQDAIKWEALLEAAEIGVTVKDGIVTLTGTVDSFLKKMEAETAAKKVLGVRAVVQQIEILFGPSIQSSDTEIALAAANLFKWTWETPECDIQIKVEKGWVSLAGELPWNYQKEKAQQSVSNIIGVKGVTNSIVVKSQSHDQFEKSDIEKALKRNLLIDEKNINVVVEGNRVSLTGTVYSLYQKDEAERIAWNAPGVNSVNNCIGVNYESMEW